MNICFEVLRGGTISFSWLWFTLKHPYISFIAPPLYFLSICLHQLSIILGFVRLSGIQREQNIFNALLIFTQQLHLDDLHDFIRKSKLRPRLNSLNQRFTLAKEGTSVPNMEVS